MNRGLLIGGATLLIVATVLFAIALVTSQSASATLASCVASPSIVPPDACARATDALVTSVSLETLSGFAGLVGFVLLVVGLILEPERVPAGPMPGDLPPQPPSAQAVPPPGYWPPQDPMPPQRPPPPPKKA